MQVYLRVSPFAPVNEVVEFTRRVEAAGFDGVGYLDSQMINRDLFITMALAGAATSRIKLITAVTNPVTRHVSVLANAATTVDDVAPGRVVVWIGRGFSAVNLAGLPEASTKQMRDSITQLRALIAGEWHALPGVESHMRTGGRSIPVYLAAAGPRTTRLAGEVADGLLMAGAWEPERWKATRQVIDEAATAAGRQPSQVGMCVQLLTCIRPTREEALRDAGPMLVLRLDQPEWLAAHGIDARGIKTPQALHELYPDPMHTEDQAAALAAAETVPLELRAQIAGVLGIVGTPEDAIARLQRVAAEGISEVFLRTVNTLSFPEGEVAAYREIGPHLGAASKP
jgi:5,10-methylenetetrahydromethanopterin reductase